MPQSAPSPPLAHQTSIRSWMTLGTLFEWNRDRLQPARNRLSSWLQIGFTMHNRISLHSCNSFCCNRCTVSSRRPLALNQPYHHYLLSPRTCHGGSTRSRTDDSDQEATRSLYRPQPQTHLPRERSSPSLGSSRIPRVTAPETEPAPDAGTVFSDNITPESSLVFPIDPAVSKRAATISLKKSKPLGAELKILQNDHAAVVWDRLLSFGKAKVTGGTSATNQDKRICRLVDKADAETEYNMSWIGEAAKHRVEASTLALYIREWMLRVERGTITPIPEGQSLHAGTSCQAPEKITGSAT